MNECIYFGRAVKKNRAMFGFSQEVLAEKADLNRSYLGEVERGSAIPSLSTIKKIANAFGISSAELLAQADQIEQVHLQDIA